MASDGKRLFEGSFGRYVNYCSETASTQNVEALETIKGNCRLRVTPQAPGTYYYTIKEIGDKRFSDWNYELNLSAAE